MGSRGLFILACLTLAAGCHGPSYQHWAGQDGNCAPGCPPPQQQCRQPQRENLEDRAPERTTRTTQTVERSQAALSQEVMLVPRTVYVPFVAQTPLAPVRLGALTQGGATFTTERRETSESLPDRAPRREEDRAPPRREEDRAPEGPCAADLAAMLHRLNCRLDQIEARLGPACPSPCQQNGPVLQYQGTIQEGAPPMQPARPQPEMIPGPRYSP
jgi:hypothetical protein